MQKDNTICIFYQGQHQISNVFNTLNYQSTVEQLNDHNYEIFNVNSLKVAIIHFEESTQIYDMTTLFVNHFKPKFIFMCGSCVGKKEQEVGIIMNKQVSIGDITLANSVFHAEQEENAYSTNNKTMSMVNMFISEEFEFSKKYPQFIKFNNDNLIEHFLWTLHQNTKPMKLMELIDEYKKASNSNISNESIFEQTKKFDDCMPLFEIQNDTWNLSSSGQEYMNKFENDNPFYSGPEEIIPKVQFGPMVTSNKKYDDMELFWQQTIKSNWQVLGLTDSSTSFYKAGHDTFTNCLMVNTVKSYECKDVNDEYYNYLSVIWIFDFTAFLIKCDFLK